MIGCFQRMRGFLVPKEAFVLYDPKGMLRYFIIYGNTKILR